MGKIQAKSHHTLSLTAVAGYKWPQKVVIFGKVTKKSLTKSEAFLEFRFRPPVGSNRYIKKQKNNLPVKCKTVEKE